MIKILTIGKIKEKNIKLMVEEFLNRINRFYKTELLELNEEAILRLIEREDSCIVACDEKGEMLCSVEFSSFIKEKINNKNLIFVVGDENGLSSEIKNKSNLKLSFSKSQFRRKSN